MKRVGNRQGAVVSADLEFGGMCADGMGGLGVESSVALGVVRNKQAVICNPETKFNRNSIWFSPPGTRNKMLLWGNIADVILFCQCFAWVSPLCNEEKLEFFC